MGGAAARSGIRTAAVSALALALAFGAAPSVRAQAGARPLITAPVDDTQLTRLRGNTRPEARAANDRGRVADSFPLNHMLLLLRRPAEREQALEQYLTQLHTRGSPYFHRWLTAAQLGERYGLASPDTAAITAWLRRQGFAVNTVYPSTLVIDFSGTAGAVRGAFHTEIHALNVRGERHIANMGDPQIPAALAPAVAGIVSLYDFRPRPMARRVQPQFTVPITGGSVHLVVPADLATIYSLTALFSAGITGQNQTIAVIEDTDLYSTADWSTFRTTFGLSAYGSPTLTPLHPAPPMGANNCGDPGVLGGLYSFEAILDAEYASAAAPAAAVEVASCADSGVTFGGLIALQNLVEGTAPPGVVSISYGECEVDNGVAANSMYSTAYQTAVAAGISVFVAAGDEGAAGCDPNASVATHGTGVNGFASTAYNVAVGGTDFGDTYAGTASSYWSANNSAVYGSALSYVPEIPWNQSCASALLAGFEGFAKPYGSGGFCSSSAAAQGGFLTTAAGSGGASSCAVSVTGGGCAGTPKPSWQAAPGNPHDSVRDLPDVSLFASVLLVTSTSPPWGHAYVVCWSNVAAGGAACSGAPSGWTLGGGTSFAAPILAGVQALVNQSTGARQGNPNTVYYTLFSSQSASGLHCNSSSGNAASAGCVFYDVTSGDMDVDCQGASNCYLPSGTYGTLSSSDAAYQPTYAAGPGWDFATGLGSINAANLVKFWTSSDLALTAAGSVIAGGLLSYNLTVANRGPQSASSVVVSTVVPAGFALIAASSSAGCKQTGQTISCPVSTLAVGAASAAITIVIQPGASGLPSLVFKASSSNADLNPSDGTATVALNLGFPGDVTDGPLPLWANLALGLLLLGIAYVRTAGARS